MIFNKLDEELRTEPKLEKFKEGVKKWIRANMSTPHQYQHHYPMDPTESKARTRYLLVQQQGTAINDE